MCDYVSQTWKCLYLFHSFTILNFFLDIIQLDESAYKLLLKKDHAHDKDINSVHWSSKDNMHLASASDDGTIKIWELASLS